jgi:AcrR family transcriptional regulator
MAATRNGASRASADNTFGSPKRGHAREQAILAATVSLIHEVGYERTTIDAIAARARASKTTIYRRWADKQALVAAALRATAEPPVVLEPEPQDVETELLQQVERIANALVTDSGLSLLALVSAVRDDHVLRDLIREQITNAGRTAAIEASNRSGKWGSPIDSSRWERVFALAVADLFTRALLSGNPPDREERGELVREVLLPLVTRPADPKPSASASTL